jgi:hypothetical protein
MIFCSSHNDYDDNEQNDSKDHQEQTSLHIKFIHEKKGGNM